jgi:hypothetical protein
MKNDASGLENRCDYVYDKILNVKPFEGPGLERELRKIEADVKKLLTKAKSLANMNVGKVREEDVSEIDDIWAEIAASLGSCEGSLCAGRDYLEEVSILVFLGSIITEIRSTIRDTMRIVGTEIIKGLLPNGK